MKRTILATLTLLAFTSSAWADRQIPQAQISTYVEAVQIALRASGSLTCGDGRSYRGSEFVQDLGGINEISVAEVGSQPIITLTSARSSSRTVIEVTTNPERTIVTGIRSQSYTIGRANTGTVDAPNIIDTWVPSTGYNCVQR